MLLAFGCAFAAPAGAGFDIAVPLPEAPACAVCPVTVTVPGGPALLGSATGPAEERPEVDQVIAALVLVQSEITVGEIRRFEAATGQAIPRGCWVWTAEGRMRFRDGAYWGAPGFEVAEDTPAACLSWDDAVAYAAWLSEEDPGGRWRLPSEAEFEYAARAGKGVDYPWPQGLAGICAAVNGADAESRFRWRNTACADGTEAPVPADAFPVNGFGLSHMIGNLWEWTEDCFNPSHRGAPQDGSARLAGNCGSRVLRGGSWDDPVENLRASHRVAIPKERRQANVGFRLVRVAD
ncbi:MAG: SUMF1/EgtB/PvdO family nonheme iron enzyme [Pseudomonadota bacterium]